MGLTSWPLFCTLALATAFSPGPAVLLAVTNAATHGASKALLGSAGNALGVFLVSATAMLGLGALLKTSVIAFAVLKILGAAYLVYLGVRQWRNRSNPFERLEDAAYAGKRKPIELFLQGLLVAVTNPNSILFFTALLPQFMTAQAPPLRQFFALTLTFAICTVASHLCYVALARGMRRWFAHERRARWFNRAAGAVFAALGVGMLRLRQTA